MSEITRSTVETRRYHKTIPETLIEPKPRKVGFTAFAVEITQQIVDGKVDAPKTRLIGFNTRRDGARVLYSGTKHLALYGLMRFQLEYGHTEHGQEVADQLAREALSEFEAIDWDAQTVAP